MSLCSSPLKPVQNWLTRSLLLCVAASSLSAAPAGAQRRDIFSEDVERYTTLLTSPVAERRVEGVQGLSYLKHWPSEQALLSLLNDPSHIVRRETVLALNRLGTEKTVPHFVRLLDDPSWELRQNAWLGLCNMTAQKFPAESKPWDAWWKASAPSEKRRILLAALTANQQSPEQSRSDILRALRHCASADDEGALLKFLETPHQPPLNTNEEAFVAEALERVGSRRAIPVLARQQSSAAAWALGRIGGAEAERALLTFPQDLAAWLNLDRLQSTNAAPYIPELVSDLGLVTYRSHPDDLHMEIAQPIQRVAANLIIRSGQAPQLIEAVVHELEATMDPPLSKVVSKSEIPSEWRSMLRNMREELKPGFVRGDGHTTSQPLTALYHIAEDQALASRLVPLLRHPAFVARVYVAMTLGKLGAREALPGIVELIREGYRFSDATVLASGKHSEQSQTVRWRGFLCMALGRMRTDDARSALESFASDSTMFRDIRYSAVVGLGFIGSPKSVPVLNRIAQDDVIWMVRDAARRTAGEIQLLSKETVQ